MPDIPNHPLDRTRIRVVLVRARNPNNIGAVARAMHDFGFSDLRLVNDYPVPLEAARSAIDASAVLQSSTVAETLAEAVTGCTLVVGTTAVGERDIQHTLLTLSEATPKIQSETARPEHEGRVALLFGSEKTGLSNDDLSLCDLLLTIPMALHEGLRHPSMNLGQAVAVCLWELIRPGPPIETTTRQPADAAEIERVNTLLYEVLETTEYTRRHGARSDPAEIRRLVHRMTLGTLDAQVWLGILRQVLWKIRRP